MTTLMRPGPGHGSRTHGKQGIMLIGRFTQILLITAALIGIAALMVVIVLVPITIMLTLLNI